MSTYYYGTLYKKQKDGILKIKNIDMNCVKNFMCGWEIEANEVWNIDEQLTKFIHENEFYYTYKYIGEIEKEKIPNFEKYLNRKENQSNILVFYEEDFDELEKIINEIQIEVPLSFTDSNGETKFFNYFSVEVRLKNYYNGNLYDVNSFDEIIESSKEKLKEIEENKRKWNNIKYSIEYLKLSNEEKENVWKSFEYEIEDEDNYYKYKLESARMLKYTLSLFSDEENAYFYIYSDNSCKLQDIPKWIKDKLTRW